MLVGLLIISFLTYFLYDILLSSNFQQYKRSFFVESLVLISLPAIIIFETN
jgi:hypothetical protein